MPERRVGQTGSAFLFVGALERAKGVDVLLEAIAAVKSRDVIFHVVGRGRLDRLVNQCADRDSRITFHGYVTREELTSLYQLCDVLLFTSQWPEVFPTVVSEALSFEMPVIASSVGGVVEMVSERNGWLVSPGSARDLARAIERIAENPHLLDEKRLKSPMSEAFCSIEGHVKALQSIYTQISG